VKRLKQEQFIKTNSEVWKELEGFSAIINKKGIKALSSHEVKRFLHVFRQSSHHLAYARTHYQSDSVVSYLNSLVGKCHSHVYTVKKSSLRELWDYIIYGFPTLLRQYKGVVTAAFGFFMLGALLSFIAVLYNPENAYLFLPPGYVEAIKGGHEGGGQWNYPLMSSYIMVNNIKVSLLAFVLGITLGLGTIYVLVINGALLGALTGIVYLYGNPVSYWSLILPHGVIELCAIFIAGGGGLMIAKAMLLPGEHSRGHSLIKGAKQAVSLVVGIIFMLIIAGIIEGFFTPLEIAPSLKLIFAAFTAVISTLYFSVPYLIKK
jgi:uncharacterized membrane protein SpoIIM required for sporulation